MSRILTLPPEILAKCIDLPVAARKAFARTCKQAYIAEHDELTYKQIYEAISGKLLALPATSGGSWEVQYKHFLATPLRTASIDSRRMSNEDRAALYDEFSNQEGWD